MQKKEIITKPELKFCKENIIHIINDFNNAVKLENIVLSSEKRGTQPIYDQEKYKPIKSNKSTITLVRKTPEALWMKISEEVFRNLIDVLYEHRNREGKRTLTLWDNAKAYYGAEAIYHSRNHFYKSDPKFDSARLVGTYRTFKNATNDFKNVLIGKLKISLVEGTNILTTKETAVYNPDGDKIPYVYEGTIHHYPGETPLIWEDTRVKSPDQSPSVRNTRLRIRKAREGLEMEGFMFVDLKGFFVRKIFIDSKELLNNTPSMVPYTSDEIPEDFRQYLTPKSIQKLEFSAG